jgi:hypothetical protein
MDLFAVLAVFVKKNKANLFSPQIYLGVGKASWKNKANPSTSLRACPELAEGTSLLSFRVLCAAYSVESLRTAETNLKKQACPEQRRMEPICRRAK